MRWDLLVVAFWAVPLLALVRLGVLFILGDVDSRPRQDAEMKVWFAFLVIFGPVYLAILAGPR